MKKFYVLKNKNELTKIIESQRFNDEKARFLRNQQGDENGIIIPIYSYCYCCYREFYFGVVYYDIPNTLSLDYCINDENELLKYFDEIKEILK